MTYAEAIRELSRQGYCRVHTNDNEYLAIVDHFDELFTSPAYGAQVVMQFDGPGFAGPCRIHPIIDGSVDTGKPLATVLREEHDRRYHRQRR